MISTSGEEALGRMSMGIVSRWNSASYVRRLCAIVVAGLVLRLVWAWFVPVIPISDSTIYWVTSQNIVLHGVYGVEPDQPFGYWPVGASAIYAGGHVLFGVNTVSIQIVNVIASLLVVVTTAQLGRRWFDDSVGLGAGALLAFWPSLLMYSTVLASEVFLMLFVNLALLAWAGGGRRWILRAAGAGIAIAGALYVRPVGLFIPPILLTLDYLHYRRRGWAPVAFAAVAVSVTALALAPWVARNYAVHDSFVLVSTNGGPNLWMGNNPDTTGGYMPLPEFTRSMSEVEREDVLGRIARDYMLENPVRTITTSLGRVLDTHSRETIAVAWNREAIVERFGERLIAPLKLVASAYWMAALLGALAGVVMWARRAWREESIGKRVGTFAHPSIVLWAYYVALHGLIVGNDRYHFPSIPFIAVLASLAIVSVFWRKALPSGR